MRQPKIKDKRIDVLNNYIKRGDFRIAQIAEEVGVTQQTIYNWADGKAMISRLASPRVDMFLRRAPRLAQINAADRAKGLVSGC